MQHDMTEDLLEWLKELYVKRILLQGNISQVATQTNDIRYICLKKFQWKHLEQKVWAALMRSR
jgi:hypothetical protein